MSKVQERLIQLQHTLTKAEENQVKAKDAFALVVMPRPQLFKTNEYKETKRAANEVDRAKAALERFKKEAGIKDQ